MQFIYFHGSQCCLKESSHSETKQIQCANIQNGGQKKVLFWFVYGAGSLFVSRPFAKAKLISLDKLYMWCTGADPGF